MKKLYLALVLIFLYAPIAVLIVFSFNANRVGTTWGGFSLHWYGEVFRNPSMVRAIQNTFFIGFTAATAATIIGTLAAVSINNMRKKSKKIVLAVSSLPVATPDTVIGVSLMILYLTVFSLIGAGRFGMGTLLVSHIAFCIPYVILSVMPRFKLMNHSIYEAALDLGASPIKAFMSAIVPQLAPGMITGFLLAFTMSIDDFMVSFFTTGPGVNNISLMVFSMASRGVNPSINALSAMMFAIVMICLLIVNFRDSKRLRRLK